MADGVLLTRQFVVVIFWLCVAFDVYAIQRHGPSASISVVLYEWSRDAPIIAGLAFGIVCHIFWKH